MSGKRRLKAHAPRLLGRHDGTAGRAFRRAYDALEADLGPFASDLVRFEAGRTAVAMVNLETATHALAAARRERERGKGRRPGSRDVERLARRQGLADQSYGAAVARLETLAGERKPLDLAAELRRQRSEP